MKKLILMAFVAIAIQATSQTTQDKINKTDLGIWKANNAIQGTSNTVNGTTNAVGSSVNGVQGVGNQLSGLFGSSKKTDNATANTNDSKPSLPENTNAKQVPAAQVNNTTTIITVANCDYNTLRELSTSLSACASVSGVDKALNNNTATITLSHTGTTDSILDYIESKSPNRFNVNGLQNGSITLGIK